MATKKIKAELTRAHAALAELYQEQRTEELSALLRRVKAVKGVARSEQELRKFIDGFSDFDDDTRRLMYLHSMTADVIKVAAGMLRTILTLEFGEEAAASLVDLEAFQNVEGT